MLKNRLIPVLFLKNGFLVRSEKFTLHKNIGNPIAQVQRYNDWDVDELIYIDITRSGGHDYKRKDLGGIDNNSTSSIENIIRKAKKGQMYILVDDEHRENEGDLVIPASNVSPKKINFMAKHGRGLICLALTKKQVDNLKLPLMSSINKSRMQTAFTVSIEAKKGITTGISAQDRAKTIQTAINSKVKKSVTRVGVVCGVCVSNESHGWLRELLNLAAV